MHCYILQGVAGVATLAAIIAAFICVIWLVSKLFTAVENFFDYSTFPIWLEYLGATAFIGVISTAIAWLAWQLGGVVVQQWFHVCLG